jgi:hypothetical protein
MFSRSGWSVVRSASLAKEGTSKKRPSPHLHKVSTRSNKISPRTLRTALVICSHIQNKVERTEYVLVSCPGDAFYPFSPELLIKVFGSMREEVTGGWENHIARNVIICTVHQKLLV